MSRRPIAWGRSTRMHMWEPEGICAALHLLHEAILASNPPFTAARLSMSPGLASNCMGAWSWLRHLQLECASAVQRLPARGRLGASLNAVLGTEPSLPGRSRHAAARVDGNAPRRARQLRGELERLGPAYVKVAQAVSTRVDILSPEYLVEMELLQDRVPPFPTSQALAAIEAALGQPVKRAFTRISQAPVASASLGQVYNGVLSDSLGGAEVAVKVQRPHVLARVALDLFLMRWLAKAAQQFPQVCAPACGDAPPISVLSRLHAAVRQACELWLGNFGAPVWVFWLLRPRASWSCTVVMNCFILKYWPIV